jgi:glycosyltransferase involved in cell wall biosynthesis
VLDLATLSEEDARSRLEAFSPELIHAFHAFLAGPVARRLATERGTPFIVTITGTDANYDLLDPSRAHVVKEVLSRADAIVAFHEFMRRKVLSLLPDLASRFFVIPQSVWLTDGRTFPLLERVPVTPENVIFLLPAGIRPVKRPRYALEALEKLLPRHPYLRLFYAGPIIDENEGGALRSALSDRPWTRYLGEVPHEQMRSLLEHVDVILNTSRSEGGMANSVLEAMSVGRPVLAADIEGNRSVIEDGLNGLLFRTEEECAEKAERLLLDPELRRRLGVAAREKVQREFPREREIDAYLRLYQQISVKRL